MIFSKKRVCEFSFMFLVLAASIATLARAQEVDDEREFSYDESSEVGPSRWGEIHSEWKDCNSGQMQSPIDLRNKRVKIVSHLGKLKRSYKPANATLINRGHDMMLRWINDAGHIKINGTKFYLRQCHWHSPSEHTLDGRKFDMEVHLVHESDTGRMAVIGIMYKIGRRDTFISMLKPRFQALSELTDIEKTIGVIDPYLIKFGSRKYYRYIGSLTIPPCTPNIIWSIVRKVRTVTKEQVNLIREAVHDNLEVNARPIQRTNGRSVEIYRPNDPKN
ncbi:alpha carbonic anhydrase 7-like [Salvia splendens]|uniref:alpha carbonic anhydrase 7-like n=1 Tax=Salvia splendens TaxID=180675 RepID=UPI001C26B0B7|nr:alpha carbonic anhydrase 7-like [Salvia splendens]